MNYKIEKEFKVLIDKKQFDRIVEAEDLQLIIQENFYYDTHEENTACRIRNIEDLYIFTLKKVVDNQVFEYEYQVNDNDINDPYIQEFLKRQNITQKPIFLGSMLTCRYFKKLKYGELVIDLNKYLNHEDYEIEYELFDPKNNIQDEFLNFLNKYKIEFKENKNSKFKRFKERLTR